MKKVRQPKGTEVNLFATEASGTSAEGVSLKSEGERAASRTYATEQDPQKSGASRKSEGEQSTRGVKSDKVASGKATEARGGVSLTVKGAKSQPVYVRLPEAMLEAIEKAVSDSPIEFGDRSEFIRRAIESELRRRGLVAHYK